MSKTLVLGLDLGGTKIAAGVVESSGTLRSKARLSTPCKGVAQDLAALFDSAHAAVAAARVSWKAISAVGVGVPGAFDPERETVWAPNLPGWKKVPIHGLLQKVLARPVFVEADRNVQALAEAWLGIGGEKDRIRNLVFFAVGTGIGAGLISEGRLISGTRGVAGAAGWLVVSADWLPEFGRIGSLEALGAGPAVVRFAREALRARARSLIRTLARAEGGRVTAEIVAQAARRGDQTARQVLEEVGTNLGRGVASIVSLLNPEVVVVGGGLAEAGELILRPLRRTVRKWGQPLAVRHMRIVRSTLGEDAGILGAARYAQLRLEGKI